MKTIVCDYFVVGSGIAGLMSALHLSKHGKVLIATKKDRADSNTNYAQGGIACVVSSDDSMESHVQDTLAAGAGLCDEQVVRQVVEGGPARIAELEELGVLFSGSGVPQGSEYDLGREGGHSHRRVLHSGDITGRCVEEVLLDRVQATPGIRLIERSMLIDLVTTGWLGISGENRCLGAYVLDARTSEIYTVRAEQVILATGGGGKVYLYTSNPDIATGDGVAVAWRAGLPVRNMEFIQFHPTCLHHPEAKSFLISEAVRGEGARLVDSDGEEFMDKYDDRGALAVRDVVARAIDSEMKLSGEACRYLDIRDKSREFLEGRFPNIFKTCLSYGIDMSTDLIPVVPAAHYFCGGVSSDITGETALPGLSVCGEVACTGLHGANRLASNSLLEAVVCAHRMSERLKDLDKFDPSSPVRIPSWKSGAAVPSDEAIVVEHNWNEVRTCMWDYVGIVRTNKRLERAMRRIHNLCSEIREYYLDYVVTPDILELRNIAAVAELIIRSAAIRGESRGLHFSLDYPPQKGQREPVDTIISRSDQNLIKLINGGE